MKSLLGSIGILMCGAFLAFGESINLKPASDTTLFQDFPDNNLGAVTSFAAGTTAHGLATRALIKFDVAGQIPADTIVTSARLRITVVKAPLGPQPSTFFLRRVLRDWGEGTKSVETLGDLATDGEASWNNRFHPGTGWATPGGAAGVDFSNAASSSTPSATNGVIVFSTSPQMVADVQHWVANPNQNFGWMIVSGSEQILATARRFASREDVSNAPVLEVEYAPPFRIENPAVANGQLRFSFTVEPLFTYTVESRSSLGSGSWNPLTNFTEKTSSYKATISDGLSGPTRFYRVLKDPCNCR